MKVWHNTAAQMYIKKKNPWPYMLTIHITLEL